MSEFSEDLAAHLVTLGLGVVPAAGVEGTLYRDFMPEQPDVLCAVVQTGGRDPEFGFGSAAIRYEWPTASIQFRALRYDSDAARDRAMTAYRAFAAVENGLVNSVRYISIRPLQMPFRINFDEQERPIWGFNVMGRRER